MMKRCFIQISILKQEKSHKICFYNLFIILATLFLEIVLKVSVTFGCSSSFIIACKHKRSTHYVTFFYL